MKASQRRVEPLEPSMPWEVLPRMDAQMWVLPEWKQLPPEKRDELVQVLAEMLFRQVQKQRLKHERLS